MLKVENKEIQSQKAHVFLILIHLRLLSGFCPSSSIDPSACILSNFKSTKFTFGKSTTILKSICEEGAMITLILSNLTEGGGGST